MVYDTQNQIVGRLKFKREWKADMAAFEAALEKGRGSNKRVVWWTGEAIVFGLVFLKLLVSRETVPASVPPTN